MTKMKQGKTLKILTIGNSFSEDAQAWLWPIAKKAGVENVYLGSMYIGGCDLDTHYNNAMTNAKAYTYRLNRDDQWIDHDGYTLAEAISSQDWDFISFQQTSLKSGQESTFSKLLPLINYTKAQLRDNAHPTLVWHMTWAYQQGYFALNDYGGSQEVMYHAITETVKKIVLPIEDLKIVIPSGTAIQNARTSFVGDTLNRDELHLSYDLGRYIAGLTFFKALTGWDLGEDMYVPAGITEAQRTVAVEAVNNAIEKPFEVTNSVYLTEEDAKR